MNKVTSLPQGSGFADFRGAPQEQRPAQGVSSSRVAGGAGVAGAYFEQLSCLSVVS